MRMEQVRLTTCANDFKAHLLQSQLETEGIPSFISNEIMHSYTNDGCDVYVNDFDYERAVDIMSGLEL